MSHTPELSARADRTRWISRQTKVFEGTFSECVDALLMTISMARILIAAVRGRRVILNENYKRL
jgi:hypothetical protein